MAPNVGHKWGLKKKHFTEAAGATLRVTSRSRNEEFRIPHPSPRTGSPSYRGSANLPWTCIKRDVIIAKAGTEVFGLAERRNEKRRNFRANHATSHRNFAAVTLQLHCITTSPTLQTSGSPTIKSAKDQKSLSGIFVVCITLPEPFMFFTMFELTGSPFISLGL